MTTTTLTRTAVTLAPTATSFTTNPPKAIPDNRSTYLAWGGAWLVGQGAFALTSGPEPVVAMPGWLPVTLLAAGVLAAVAVTAMATVRDSRGLTGPAKTAGTLIGVAWGVGFTALFLLITAVAGQVADPHLQSMLWPAGTGLVVGLTYLLSGTAQRDLHQYALGSWLALSSTAGLFLGLPGLYWVVALAGGGAYLTAAALEPRRRTAAAAAAAAATATTRP